MNIANELDVFVCPLEGINQIEASAGTGKTWNIAALYVRLLLETSLTVEQILVVTFTDAATAELHERIRARIAGLAHWLEYGDRDVIDDPFIERLEETTLSESLTHEQALQRLRLALNAFDQASIRTIHGFCRRALEEAPFAAALPFEFELDGDDAQMRLDIATRFWRERVEPEAAQVDGFAAWLVSRGATPASLDDELRRRLKKPLAELRWDPAVLAAAEAALEASDRPRASKTEAPHEVFERTIGAAWEIWGAEQADIEQTVEAGLAVLNKTSYKTDTLRAVLDAWAMHAAERDPHAPLPDKFDLLRASMLAGKTNKGKTPPAHRFFEQVDAVLDAMEAAQDQYRTRWLALIHRWLDWAPYALAEVKRAQRALSFDDLLSNLQSALNQHEWLAPTLRDRYPAALIDEFQDTDPLQFDIFHRIYAPDGPLFLVGDPKQAIYSFRAADLHTYLRAREVADERYSLAVNQRSTAAMIDACNRLFTANPRAFVLEGLDYVPVRPGQRKREPFVDARGSEPGVYSTESDIAPGGQFDADADSGSSLAYDDVERVFDPALHIWQLPTDELLDKSSFGTAAADACAAEIVRLLGDARRAGARVGERPLTPGQIAVLVQTRRQAAEIKRVLSRWGIASVELTRESVFATEDAAHIERLLLAIEAPGDLRRLRAALAIDWMGLDAAAIARLDDIDRDDDLAEPASLAASPLAPPAVLTPASRLAAQQASDATPWVERLTRYRSIWHERGFAPMWRTLLRELRIAQRIVALPLGERRLTDLSHLAELLQTRAAEQAGAAPMLRWLAAQRAMPPSSDDVQLRLESDRNLVQIVTVHKSKGLEYSVVFCPYLADGLLQSDRGGKLPVPDEYHDDDGQVVIDYRMLDEALSESIDLKSRIEQAAERARLVYVALTRSVYRCYLVAGIYRSGKSTKEAQRSVLNWLVAGAGRGFAAWLDAPPEPAEIAGAWQALAGGSIVLEPMPLIERATGVSSQSHDADDFIARVALRHLREAWRISSFSALIEQRHEGYLGEPSALRDPRPDHDERVSERDDEVQVRPAGLARLREAGDIVDFPRGAAAGECLHRLFELADFTSSDDWPEAIARALAERPVPAAPELARRMPAMMSSLLTDVCATVLTAFDEGEGGDGLCFVDVRSGPGLASSSLEHAKPMSITLSAIALHRRLTELEFMLSARSFDLHAMTRLLLEYGYPNLVLDASTLHGYLRGFIDLVFEYRGRYWIIDWKSNHLGDTETGYDRVSMAAAMDEHGYALQSLIYCVALHRYLRSRIADYDYERHFGASLYLFVRGVRPQWRDRERPTGVHQDRPPRALIERFDALLEGGAP
ncbi:UvrD-helicase domain-containing protein [Pararobbsia alpina]|uniref:RecBCD enzyme subunit RecB n=1 Tax=Pararobbsia alpina TaxID=621374 RepID=A0A6S7CPR2_9BURK|nr:UvrD-helicase domain-containing protein [Pararobbsia alpina]CAB3784800.1 RecBCD enzyme subunit RecB [Pararobbsia alpina]